MSPIDPQPDSPSGPIGRPSGTPVVIDGEGLGSCFGCSATNPYGLALQFLAQPDGMVETRTRVAAHYCGVDQVVHGGIQTTILDEVMGVAAQVALPAAASRRPCVTAELSVRFLRPVPLAEEVVARARVVHRSGDDLYVHGDIVDRDGIPLTSARSRWRQLRV